MPPERILVKTTERGRGMPPFRAITDNQPTSKELLDLPYGVSELAVIAASVGIKVCTSNRSDQNADNTTENG